MKDLNTHWNSRCPENKKITLFIIWVHNYSQKFLVFSSNTWITRPDFLRSASETKQCFSNERKNILLINFIRLFYSDEISEKQMENKISFPDEKATLIRSHVKPFILFTISVRSGGSGLLLTKVMFTIFMRLKEGFVHTRIWIHIFSDEHEHPWQDTIDHLATKDGEDTACYQWKHLRTSMSVKCIYNYFNHLLFSA